MTFLGTLDRFTAIALSYWAVCIAAAFLLPSQPVFPDAARAWMLDFPTVSALHRQPGALAILPDYFLVAWGALPVWLVALLANPPQFQPGQVRGWPRLIGVTLALLFMCAVFIFLLLFLSPSPTPSRRVAGFLLLTSRYRAGLGLVIGLMMTVFLMCTWAVVAGVPRAALHMATRSRL